MVVAEVKSQIQRVTPPPAPTVGGESLIHITGEKLRAVIANIDSLSSPNRDLNAVAIRKPVDTQGVPAPKIQITTVKPGVSETQEALALKGRESICGGCSIVGSGTKGLLLALMVLSDTPNNKEANAAVDGAINLLRKATA